MKSSTAEAEIAVFPGELPADPKAIFTGSAFSGLEVMPSGTGLTIASSVSGRPKLRMGRFSPISGWTARWNS